MLAKENYKYCRARISKRFTRKTTTKVTATRENNAQQHDQLKTTSAVLSWEKSKMDEDLQKEGKEKLMTNVFGEDGRNIGRSSIHCFKMLCKIYIIYYKKDRNEHRLLQPQD